MKVSPILVLFFLLCYGLSAQNPFDRFYTNPAKGVKHQMNLNFTDSFNHQTTLPVVIIKGREPGKVFTILSGVHGAELAPIIATQKLLQQIEPSQLRGTLIILPITNVGAFYGYTPYINPIDKRNINRAFPGREDGTVSEKIAHFISTKIIPVSDVLLDAHSGDLNEDLLPFVCYYENKSHPNKTKKAKELSEYSGFENVISYPYTLANDQPAKFAFKQACQAGKVALSFESGKLGYIQNKAVDRILRGYQRILDKLDMYDYQDPLGDTPYKILKSPIYIDAKVQGIFYTDYKAGDKVIKGVRLGNITNSFGTTLQEVVAPVSGIILYMKGVPPTNVDDTLFSISPNEKKE